MLSLLLFIAPLLWFGWSGYRKGLAQSLGPLLGWLVAYPVTFWFTRPLVRWLQEHTPLQGMAVYLAASTLLFGATCLLVVMVFNRLTGKGLIPSLPSRLAGLGLGLSLGVLVGVLLVYAFTLRPSTTQVAVDKAPVIERKSRQWIAQATGVVVGFTLQDRTSGQLLRALVESPQATLNHIKEIGSSPALQNPQVQQLLQERDQPGLMAHPSFRQLLQDKPMRALLAQADIRSETDTQAAAERLATLLSKLERLRQDPSVHAMLSNPQLQQQLRDANHLELMTNPQLSELLEYLWIAATSDSRAITQYRIKDGSTQTEAEGSGTIYRWSDDDGQVHYSDNPR